MPGHSDGLDHLAVGEGDAEREDEVFDLAVPRREDPRSAGSDVAADSRQVDRGGVVRKHEAALVQGPLERFAVDARLGRHRQRPLVHVDDPVEARKVEQDASPGRDRPSLAARAAAAGDDGEAALVRVPEDGGHARLVGREHRDVGEPERCPAARAASAFQYVSAE